MQIYGIVSNKRVKKTCKTRNNQPEREKKKHLEKVLEGYVHNYIFALPKTKWPVGQGVKTRPFHGRITSSILVRATKAVLLTNSLFYFPLALAEQP